MLAPWVRILQAGQAMGPSMEEKDVIVASSDLIIAFAVSMLSPSPRNMRVCSPLPPQGSSQLSGSPSSPPLPSQVAPKYSEVASAWHGVPSR